MGKVIDQVFDRCRQGGLPQGSPLAVKSKKGNVSFYED